MSNNATNLDELSKITAEDLREAINDAIYAGRPLMVHGSPGIGKSAATLQAAQDQCHRHGLLRVVQQGEVSKPEEEYGYFDVRLTNMGPEEFGLPSADNDRGIQTRLPVDWYPSTDRDDLPEFGLLVFEELWSVSPSMQAAVYQIMHEKRLGDKRMKPGWSIVATGNLLTDGGVVHKIATPLANRGIHVYVKSDVDSFCRHALANGFDPVVVGFIRFRPDLLNTFEQHVKNKGTGHAFATERSWEMTSDLIKDGGHSKVRTAMIAGTIGAGPAMEFNAFRKVWKEMPNIDQIMMDPHKAEVPERGATAYAVSAALAGRAKPDNFSTILIYAERMPREFMMMIVKDSARRNRDVMSTSAFVKFSSTHSDLII